MTYQVIYQCPDCKRKYNTKGNCSYCKVALIEADLSTEFWNKPGGRQYNKKDYSGSYD